MLDYPKSYYLGTIEAPSNSKTSNFYGANIRSALDLPEFLIVGHLDRRTFVSTLVGNFLDRMIGRGPKKWSARWQGENDSSWLDVSWNPDNGWSVDCRWFGKSLCLIKGFASKSFQEVFSTALGFGSAIDSNPAKLQIDSLALPPNSPQTLSLPSGALRTLVIPLPLDKVTNAHVLWNSFRKLSAKLTTTVRARIVLLRQSVLVNNHTNDHVLSWLEHEEKYIGLVPLELPLLIDERIRYERLVYCLEIIGGFADMPKLTRHFSGICSQTPGMSPLFMDPLIPSIGETVHNVYQDDQSVVWRFEKHWKQNSAEKIPNVSLDQWVQGIEELTKHNLQEYFAKLQGILMSEPTNSQNLPGSIEITGSVLDDEDAEEFDASDTRDFTVLMGSVLLNPFGPTMNLLGYYEDDDALRVITLNPAGPTELVVGTIDLSGPIDLCDWETLPAVFQNISCDIFFTCDGIPEDYQREVLESAYEVNGDNAVRSLALIEAYPEDIFSRFDVEMGTKQLDRKWFREYNDAVEKLIERGISKNPELMNIAAFTHNWTGCELFFLHGNVALSWSTALPFLKNHTNLPI